MDEYSENTEVIEFEEYSRLATFLARIDKFGAKNRASQISCGDDFSLVLTEKGMIYSFGKASCYRLGQEKISQDEKLFEATPIFGLQNVKKVVAGCRNGCTINKDGSIYVWGFNFHNQLGLGENDQDQAE